MKAWTARAQLQPQLGGQVGTARGLRGGPGDTLQPYIRTIYRYLHHTNVYVYIYIHIYIYIHTYIHTLFGDSSWTLRPERVVNFSWKPIFQPPSHGKVYGTIAEGYVHLKEYYVGKTIINNPPIITIFTGAMFTIPSHVRFILHGFYPHYSYDHPFQWVFPWNKPTINRGTPISGNPI